MSTPLPPAEFADLDGLPPGERDRVALFRLLVVVGSDLRTRMDRTLASAGVTTQQAALLTIVLGLAAPPSFGEAAEALGCTHQNVKQIALALERKGLLRIEVDAGDGRVRRLVPTARAREPFADRDDSDRATVVSWFAMLSDAEVAATLASLWKVRGG